MRVIPTKLKWRTVACAWRDEEDLKKVACGHIEAEKDLD